MDKRATGWVPDYPDIRDYTLASKAIRSVLSQVQGTQIAGTLESQKENILQLLKLIAQQSNPDIQNIQKTIERFMSNDFILFKIELVPQENLVNSSNKSKRNISVWDIERIPTPVFQIILEKLVPNLGETAIKSEVLTKLIYPIVKVVAQIISPIAQSSNIEKAVVEKGIKYFTSLVSLDETEDKKKSSLSDYQTMLRWKSEHEFFKELAGSAVLDVKLAFIEDLEGVNLADVDNKQKIDIYQKVEKELKQYFDNALEAKDLPFKKVLEFDGENDYVYVESFEWPPGKPVTVEFWAKVNKGDERDSYAFTVGAKEDSNYFSVTLPWGNGVLYWEYGADQLYVDYSNYLNEWTHVALVSQGKNGTFMGIYLNGELVKSSPTSNGSTIPLKGLWIGTLNQYFYKGKIAEFRIWSQVRTQEQIEENIYKPLTGSEDRLGGYWAFDEGEGNDKVHDKTNLHHDGVLGKGMDSSSTWPEWVKDIPKMLPFKKALKFDGTNDYVQMESFEWQLNQQVTVEFWAKVNTDEVQDSFVFTVGNRESANRFCLSLIRDNHWLYWDYGDYSGSGRIDMPLHSDYLDKWIHVSVVSAGKSGKFMGIYLNGELVKSIQKSDGPTIPLKGLWIGTFIQEFQKGEIAEFRIWNKVRTRDEIKKNMSKQLTGREDSLVGYWAFDEGEGNEVADKTKFNNSGFFGGNPKPKWVDFNKSEDANVKKWVCKEKFAQTSASVPKTSFRMICPQGSQEDSIAEDQETQLLQFPILRKYLDKIQQKANSGDNSNEGDGSAGLTNLPEFVDLSFWCSPVEDQGSLNSCTANAAIALMEYFQKKSFRKYIDSSRLFLYKATRNLMQIEGNVGTSIRSTMKAMALFGVPPEEYWPYQEDKVNEEPIPFCYAFAQNYQALKYFRLDAAGIQPNSLLAQIKAILVAGIPCVFGFTLYNSIYDDSNPRGHIPYPHKRDKAEGGHAVVAVGYDDYKQIKNADGDKSKGALLIRNCWGTQWGEGGYGWLPYDYVLKGLTADWWSLLSSEWFDTEQFGLGGKDWTDNVGTPDGRNQP